MELIETTAELAYNILQAKTRKITLENNYKVTWINLNNNTCFAEKKNNGCTFDIENVKFFINVPKNAKTIY